MSAISKQQPRPQRSRRRSMVSASVRLWNSTSGVLLVVIATSLLSTALLYQVWQMTESYVRHPVQYGVSIIQPLDAEVCPGPRSLWYPVEVIVTADMVPDQVEIAESWCGFGVTEPCKTVTPADDDDLPLLREKHITGTAYRDVPDFLRPGGTYEMHHSVKDAAGDVTGYIVTPIRIKQDCP